MENFELENRNCAKNWLKSKKKALELSVDKGNTADLCF